MRNEAEMAADLRLMEDRVSWSVKRIHQAKAVKAPASVLNGPRKKLEEG